MIEYRRVVVLTGAGISAESGLGTFRDKDGLWTRYDLRDVATPEGFARDPSLVHEFYNARRRNLLDAEPNAAHFALAEWEQAWMQRPEHDFLLVTQNVDDLHERAGSQRLLHMHGELLKIRCENCGSIRECRTDIDIASVCPACELPGYLRPHVVWFGEMPLYMDQIQHALETCDLFVAIGTSGNVYPAAGFVAEARRPRINGTRIDGAAAHTVELNLEPSEGRSLFREAHDGPASEIVPLYVARLLAGAHTQMW